jgi:KDO2-lipid IV(A) lauroyltransferase
VQHRLHARREDSVNPQVLLSCGSLAAAALPRAWAEALATAAADMAAPWLAGVRGAARANLEEALDHDVSERLCREVARTYARYYLGVMRLAHRDLEAAVGPIRLHGADHVARTLERQRGVVALGAHVGNWDVSAIAMARRFGTLHAVVEPLRPEPLLRFYSRTRARHGVRVLCAGEAGRMPVHVLRANEILGLLVDRPFGRRSESVRFGRGRMQIPSGGIRLALRAGAGIHAVFALRRHDGFDVQVSPDLAGNLSDGDEPRGIHAVAQRFATALHDVVTRHPEQWCLLYPFAREQAPAPHGAEALGIRPRRTPSGAA